MLFFDWGDFVVVLVGLDDVGEDLVGVFGFGEVFGGVVVGGVFVVFGGEGDGLEEGFFDEEGGVVCFVVGEGDWGCFGGGEFCFGIYLC